MMPPIVPRAAVNAAARAAAREFVREFVRESAPTATVVIVIAADIDDYTER